MENNNKILYIEFVYLLVWRCYKFMSNDWNRWNIILIIFFIYCLLFFGVFIGVKMCFRFVKNSYYINRICNLNSWLKY